MVFAFVSFAFRCGWFRGRGFLHDLRPGAFRFGELFVVVAFEVFRLGDVSLVDGLIVVAEGLAQGEGRRPGQGG